jgi:trehalose-6-phosphatase
MYICEKLNKMKVTKSDELKCPKRLLCFDLDGTLSQHKSHMPQANKDILEKLDEKYKVIMVGA